ncbi:MAG: DUF4381 family protein [Bacteroides sp.]|nr:DUF4381 family protein [Bacteroides sp.]
MNNTLIRIILSTILSLSLFFTAVGANPSDYKATAKIDSAEMIMGSKTLLNVDFSGPLSKDARIIIDESNPDPDVELTLKVNGEPSSIGNGLKQLKQSFEVQIFDSGLYTLPAILCISGNDTVIANATVIKVDPMPLDSINLVMEGDEVKDLKINDYSDISSIKPKFWDFIPDWLQIYGWWIVAALVIIIIGLFVYLKWGRNGGMKRIFTKKVIPPYDLAISELNRLQEMQLWQKGDEKGYYTELTNILRRYLEGRFGISAMEMTTPQIMEALEKADNAKEYTTLVSAVLSQADFVKFAKARPEADQNNRSFANTRQFVELTRPVIEQPTEDCENATGNNDKNISDDSQSSSEKIQQVTDPDKKN